MASRTFMDVVGLNKFQTQLHGNFSPNGTGVPVANVGSSAAKVTRLGVGRFRLAFVSTLGSILDIGIELALAAQTALSVAVGPITHGNQIEFDVLNTTTGVATDIAANAANIIFWTVNIANDTNGSVAHPLP